MYLSSSRISIFAVALAAFGQATPVPDQIFTVSIPDDMTATNHSSNSIFCVVPSPWFGVAMFYLGNYASHAATVITYPGETPFNVILAIIFALFFPTSGIIRGLGAICRWANIQTTDLRVAARAGALCHVVRTEKWRRRDLLESDPKAAWTIIEAGWTKELPQLWPFFDTSLEQPKAHEKISGKRSRMRKLVDDTFRMERKIHGTCILPANECYALAFVPRNAEVESIAEDFDKVPTVLSSSYSFIRATIAIVQILYAATTLYKTTKGPQIAQYGYSTFGLTVAPYLIMSLVNLVGNLVTPSYDAIYLVSSPILEEARRSGGIFDGIVGQLVMEEGDRAKVDVNIEETDIPKMLNMPKTKAPRTLKFNTRGGLVLYFPPNANEPQTPVELFVTFNCPIFKRTDGGRLPMTRAAKQTKGKNFRNFGCIPAYLDRNNRADFPIPWYSYFFFTFASLFIGLLTLIPIGAISKFKENHGTHPERIWIVCWIVFGAVIGTLTGWWTEILETRSPKVKGLPLGPRLLWRLPALIFAAPGIGGFIVVGQMLRQYGDCVTLF